MTENILIGKEDAKESEVTQAAIQADAHNFITTLPQVTPSIYFISIAESSANIAHTRLNLATLNRHHFADCGLVNGDTA